MRIIAYTPLHYGRDYLYAAIRSVISHVDAYYVLYTSKGSHGTQSPVPCPESEAELRDIAHRAAGDKLRWVGGAWFYEGRQRDYIHTLEPDADIILALDADEIWMDVTHAIHEAEATGAARVRVPMVHFWRSFHRAILHDPAFPERIIFPKRRGKTSIQTAPIAHMGYAQRSEIVGYKLNVHGHIGEFRHDCNWFEDVFMANRQQDCHPVGSEYWNPEAVNWREYMPEWMEAHDYASYEVIP